MILSNQDLQKYISISPNFDFKPFLIHIPKALRTYVKRYVGNLYQELEKAESEVEHTDIKTQAKELIDTAVANFAFYLYTPYISVSMDSSGLYIVKTDKRDPISNNQLNDIRRELLRSGHEAMDELLELLEVNADVFPYWHNHYSTIYRDSLVYSTSEFNKYFNIMNSRQTFLSLKPSIINIEDKVVKTSFTADYIESLKDTVTGVNKQVKEYLQKAIVHGTIAKVYSEGVYEITPSSIVLKFDLLDYERKQVATLTEQMKNAISSHSDDMNNYLKLAYSLAEGIDDALIEKDSTKGYKPIITKSIIGI
ncbi:DUF6712 family protein [Myroides marinus]|uniref:DUF6712 family protein n=1 Tax=Myroides marinus TaxID=703342 RepID=UPI00257804D1|nr:DUF6712 family protein [Myroides marinus]MDM1378161.1 hypothetical protein [Myroides marinus]MDM1385453.1 hypothetical protein [Myroides marinus]MDM1392666.1 hypothetical protein [Myroides marinus]